MSDFITKAFVQEYKANTELLLQQKDSRFAMCVTSDSYHGKQASVVEQFGETAARKRSQRYQDTPNMDVPQEKRWVVPSDYDWGRMVDKVDQLRMIIDPTSPLAMAGAAAMQRAKDDEIIAAFFAASVTGEDAETTETFDTTNYQVAVNTGGTASSINVAKLQLAREQLMRANKGQLDETPYCAISSYEHAALLKEIEVTSRDFNGGQPVLVNGTVDMFMGFRFVITERLAISGGNRLIPAWVPSGMHLGTWEDIQAKITERADKSYAWQVYLNETIGATRLQQGKVIQILCDDQIA